MSEKVLKGFYEEIALRVPNEKSNMYVIAKQNTVPVRLASESVDLRKLKEWCEENKFRWVLTKFIENMIYWAEKEAKKK